MMLLVKLLVAFKRYYTAMQFEGDRVLLSDETMYTSVLSIELVETLLL